MAELNRDTDGFIQLAGRKCSFSRTFLSMSLTPSGCFSPAVEERKPEKLNQSETCLGQAGGNRRVGRWEDGERTGGSDETGQDISTAGGEEESKQGEAQQS